MENYRIQTRDKKVILALGAESAGNFSVYENGNIYSSEDFGNLLEQANFEKFQRVLIKFLKDEKILPSIITSDLHPLFYTTALAKQLAKKYKAEYLPIQHHLAHIFSSVGDRIIQNSKFKIQNSFIGIACDGTGYAEDGSIWGGEAFIITKKQEANSKQKSNSKLQIDRIGHLENQILIGGEMAIREPARLLISILTKITNSKLQIPNKSQNSNLKSQKDFVYKFVKKYYTRNEFEVLYSQLEQNFNCIETSSTARILDAVSILLGFSKNERISKHGPVTLLEQNSSKPYPDLKPRIERYKIQDTNIKQISNFNPPASRQISNEILVLSTTFLFEYLIKNINKDKKRLAATAQKYIADGLIKIANQSSVISPPRIDKRISLRVETGHQNSNTNNQLQITNDRLPVFFAGGMANNKIISEFLEKEGFYTSKNIPRGDAGISLGQIVYFLLNA